MPKLITGNWGHLFSADRGERTVRIVLDAEQQILIAAQVERDRATGYYSPATQDEQADLQDSLVNANSELFDDPSAFGLEAVDQYPEWAPQAA